MDGSPQRSALNHLESGAEESVVGATPNNLVYREQLKSSSTSDRNLPSTVRNPWPVAMPIQRLGTAELGPHAFEERMPRRVQYQLLYGANTKVVERMSQDGGLYRTHEFENETHGVIPLIAQLLECSQSAETAWLCHSSLCYITKLDGERGFCGYRNLQMMLSFLLSTNPTLWEKIQKYLPWYSAPGRDAREIPNVLDLQLIIENAWDKGFNSNSRIETGGIMGTRKYIGTLEVDSTLKLFGIPASVNRMFYEPSRAFPGFTWPPCDHLIDFVLRYFRSNGSDSGPNTSPEFSSGARRPSSSLSGHSQPNANRVKLTGRPPLYFQQPGHSLTIIGIEKLRDNSYNLLVFDPGFGVDDSVNPLLRWGMRLSTGQTTESKNDVQPPMVGRSQLHPSGLSDTLAQSQAAFPTSLLAPFRRSRSQLTHERYEILELL